MAYVTDLEQVQPGLVVTTWQASGYFRIIGISNTHYNDVRNGTDKFITLERLSSNSGKIVKNPTRRDVVARSLYVMPRDGIIAKADRELRKWSQFLDVMSAQQYGE